MFKKFLVSIFKAKKKMQTTVTKTVINSVESVDSDLKFTGTFEPDETGKVKTLKAKVSINQPVATTDGTTPPDNFVEIGDIKKDGDTTLKINSGFESYGTRVYADILPLIDSIENPVTPTA